MNSTCQEMIEHLLSRYSLRQVMMAISYHCEEKAQQYHASENWQNYGNAKRWEMKANVINKVATRV